MVIRHYLLVDREPIEVDLMTWAHGIDGNRDVNGVDAWQVGRTEWANGAHVSTVFLGLDYQWQPDARPLLFETMLFCEDDELDGVIVRCSTWDEALVQHRQVVLAAAERFGQPLFQTLHGVL